MTDLIATAAEALRVRRSLRAQFDALYQSANAASVAVSRLWDERSKALGLGLWDTHRRSALAAQRSELRDLITDLIDHDGQIAALSAASRPLAEAEALQAEINAADRAVEAAIAAVVAADTGYRVDRAVAPACLANDPEELDEALGKIAEDARSRAFLAAYDRLAAAA